MKKQFVIQQQRKVYGPDTERWEELLTPGGRILLFASRRQAANYLNENKSKPYLCGHNESSRPDYRIATYGGRLCLIKKPDHDTITYDRYLTMDYC